MRDIRLNEMTKIKFLSLLKNSEPVVSIDEEVMYRIPQNTSLNQLMSFPIVVTDSLPDNLILVYNGEETPTVILLKDW